jgi:protocatechuate 3,4-dioxygenase beta subunit
MLVAALFVVLVGMLLFLTWSLRDSARAETEAGRRESSRERSEPAASASFPPVEPTRSALDTAITPTPSDSRNASSDTVPLDRLRGRVVDSHRAPIAGARVSIERGELLGFLVLGNPDLALTRRAVAETASDAHGEFELELDRGVPVDLNVDAPGYCPVVLDDRHAGEFVEVALSDGFLAFGRVTRESDGAPIADAKVRVFRGSAAASGDRETRTSADGRYELRFAFEDGARLAVVPKLERRSGVIDLEPGPDGTVEENVTLPDGIVVVGRVTAAHSRAPIAGATVGEAGEEWAWGRTAVRTAVTDARGEYRLAGLGDGRVDVLLAKAPGFAESKWQGLPAVKDGVMRVDFELVPAHSAHGRVLGDDGIPLPGVLAVAVASANLIEGYRDWLPARSDADGRFRIDDLTRELPHALVLSKHGHGTRVYDFPSTELEDAEVDLGTFVLGASSLLAGVVRDASGRSMVGAEVMLEGTHSDGSRSRDEAAPRRFAAKIAVERRSTRSDAAGRFSFGELSAGEYSIYAQQHARPASRRVGRVVQDGQVIDDVELLMVTGAAIGGHVVDAQGQAIAGVWVTVRAVDVEGPGVVSDAVTCPYDCDARGEFRIENLDASVYRLDFHAPSVGDAVHDEPLLDTTVERVAVGSEDLIVVMRR